MDLSKYVDDGTVVRIVPETPLVQVHNIFRQLGIKLVLVVRFGKLAGMITKKSLAKYLHDGAIGNVKEDPAIRRDTNPGGTPAKVHIPFAPTMGVTEPLLEK